MMSQQIKVSDERWRTLNAMKYPGETFDDVVERLIENYDGEDEDTDD